MSEKVWKFTNKRELDKKEFSEYFQKKVFKTIRRYSMLPKERIIKLRKSDDLNTSVLKEVLEKKFKVIFSEDFNISSKNLSQISENTLKDILEGRFNTFSEKSIKDPLCLLSDKEVELYAEINNIKGKKRKHDEKTRSLIERFLSKNPDLELNIFRASEQIK